MNARLSAFAIALGVFAGDQFRKPYRKGLFSGIHNPVVGKQVLPFLPVDRSFGAAQRRSAILHF
ncbi:MAG: hypothetical protein ABSD56_08885, partial [Bryobacteraceae bacterium]